ncbi:hypothetical protein GAGA_0335 [Paraglaciecola agarilytica NO2]|uniref:Uncharacterized protein n=1 Tax=Paraglaciecola agarilytica NO2 TaxID=1125747 RepID=A0ABQ0I1J0_9ALTE|nr:hypothetical protein GAGA_0335 [Paraglaciecola agarilytica NO2]
MIERLFVATAIKLPPKFRFSAVFISLKNIWKTQLLLF